LRVIGEHRSWTLKRRLPHRAYIVSYASRFVTLLPGDLIFTGTPGTTRKMKPGDVIEVEIEGIGVLCNPVGRPAY
jgi:2-keto-4-pentenoate hydratase/2-oxohepta-3-ene-1,7-dioic acid hydratase in catechol pathway